MLFPVSYILPSGIPIEEDSPWKYCLRRVSGKLYVNMDPLDAIHDNFVAINYHSNIVPYVGDIVVRSFPPKKKKAMLGIEPNGELIEGELTDPFFHAKVIEKYNFDNAVDVSFLSHEIEFVGNYRLLGNIDVLLRLKN